MVEYVVILVLVAAGCGFAIVALGISLARFYASLQAWLLIPIP